MMTKWNDEYYNNYEQTWVEKDVYQFTGIVNLNLGLGSKYVNFLLTTARQQNKTAIEYLEEILEKEMYSYKSIAEFGNNKKLPDGFKKVHGDE